MVLIRRFDLALCLVVEIYLSFSPPSIRSDRNIRASPQSPDRSLALSSGTREHEKRKMSFLSLLTFAQTPFLSLPYVDASVPLAAAAPAPPAA